MNRPELGYPLHCFAPRSASLETRSSWPRSRSCVAQAVDQEWLVGRGAGLLGAVLRSPQRLGRTVPAVMAFQPALVVGLCPQRLPRSRGRPEAPGRSGCAPSRLARCPKGSRSRGWRSSSWAASASPTGCRRSSWSCRCSTSPPRFPTASISKHKVILDVDVPRRLLRVACDRGRAPRRHRCPRLAVVLPVYHGVLRALPRVRQAQRRSWFRSATRPGPARTCVSIASRCSSSSRRSSRRPRSCRTPSTRFARHEPMDDAHHPVRALRRPPVHLPRRAEGRGRVARSRPCSATVPSSSR